MISLALLIRTEIGGGGSVTCSTWLKLNYLCLRSSHKPLFVRMTPLQSDWSQMGLKGIIPSLLHHTLLGYNFLIPDAVGNTTTSGSLF